MCQKTLFSQDFVISLIRLKYDLKRSGRYFHNLFQPLSSTLLLKTQICFQVVMELVCLHAFPWTPETVAAGLLQLGCQRGAGTRWETTSAGCRNTTGRWGRRAPLRPDRWGWCRPGRVWPRRRPSPAPTRTSPWPAATVTTTDWEAVRGCTRLLQVTVILCCRLYFQSFRVCSCRVVLCSDILTCLQGLRRSSETDLWLERTDFSEAHCSHQEYWPRGTSTKCILWCLGMRFSFDPGEQNGQL